MRGPLGRSPLGGGVAALGAHKDAVVSALLTIGIWDLAPGSGTIVIPAGYPSYRATAYLWGAGASGGSGLPTTTGAGGGGGGGALVKRFRAVPNMSLDWVVGAGGVQATSSNGNDGGDTTLYSGQMLLTAGGGKKGLTTNGSAGGLGGSCLGGDVNRSGGQGGNAGSNFNTGATSGATGEFGGAGGNGSGGLGGGGGPANFFDLVAFLAVGVGTLGNTATPTPGTGAGTGGGAVIAGGGGSAGPGRIILLLQRAR